MPCLPKPTASTVSGFVTLPADMPWLPENAGREFADDDFLRLGMAEAADTLMTLRSEMVRAGAFGLDERSEKPRVVLGGDWNFVDLDGYSRSIVSRMLGDDFHEAYLRRPNVRLPVAITGEIGEPLALRSVHDELSDALLQEAVALRENVVPPDAFAEILCRPFVGVHVYEDRDNVYFAWVAPWFEGRLERYFLCRINVSTSTYRWEILSEGLAAIRSRVSGAVNGEATALTYAEALAIERFTGTTEESLSALYMMSASILRDFWVVEDRENAFRLGKPRVRRVLGLSKRDERVIYLPRLKYDRHRIERATSGNGWKRTVGLHLVRSHTRELRDGEHASPLQLALAAFHGAPPVPPGHTWVKAHEAGSGKVARPSYRSRTATTTLMQVLDHTRLAHEQRDLTWFEFERRVDVWVADQGYNRITKVGDGGADILALSKKGDHCVVVQAKHHKKPVGLAVVQATATARDRWGRVLPCPVVGVLVSSSGFTGPARDEAARSSIRLVVLPTGRRNP